MIRQWLFKSAAVINKVQSRSFTNWNAPFLIAKKDRDIYLTPKKAKPSYTLIWMHGLGDSALGFLDFFNRKNSVVPIDKAKVILLTAPEMRVNMYRGFLMNSWYNQDWGDDGKFKPKQTDVRKSYDRIVKHIEEEAKIYKGEYKRILVGGFSQGCAMALITGLTFEKTLGGICGLSGFLFDFVKVDESKKDMPIFLYHGKMDDMVYYEPTLKEYERLKEKGLNVAIKLEEHLGHFVSPKEEIEVRNFFHNIMV